MGKHAVVVELFYNGVWNPAPTYERGTLDITRGIDSPQSEATAASVDVVLDNRTSAYAPRNVAGPLNGKIGRKTPARVTVDGSVRLTGSVVEWRPERAVSGDAWTKVKIVGTLGPLGIGVDPLRSAASRAALLLGPIASWPLEDGADAVQGSSALAAGAAIVPRGAVPVWGDNPGPIGSEGLPLLVSAKSWATDVLVAPVPGASATQWTISVWVRCTTQETVAGHTITLLQWETRPLDPAGTPAIGPWVLTLGANVTPGFEFLTGFDNSARAWSDGTGKLAFDGAWHHVVITCEQSGAVTETRIYIDTLIGVYDATPDVFTLKPITEMRVLRAQDVTLGPVSVWMGHLEIFDRKLTTTEIGALYLAGAAGNAGETAGNRFIRLCTEEGIAADVVGDENDTVLVGPQRPVTLLEHFAELERTDDGQVFEDRASAGLVFLPAEARLNQPVGLTLNYRGGQIAPPLSPVVGDAHVRNDVTAAAPNGATRRVEQVTGGPLNRLLVGRYRTRVDANPYGDDALAHVAGWRVNLGTFDGTWYAAVTVDLDAAPGLTAAAAALDIGGVIAIQNLPLDDAVDTVELLIIGIKEAVFGGGFRRLITFLTAPVDPYRVGVLTTPVGDSGSFLGHLDTDGSTTVGATAAGATTLSVATTSGPIWTTDADDFPLDIIVGGQRVSISAIAGGASPQTFTVQPTGLQVRYPIAAGSAVTVQQPVILAM